MCFLANSKIERTKQIASKDILVYKAAILVDDHIESIQYDYKYLPNIVSKHIKLHYKHIKCIYTHKRLSRIFKGHAIDKGYYSYINKELYTSNLAYYIAYTYIKYGFSYKPIVCAECIIPKGTKYCVNKEGIVISETIIYTGKYSII